MAGIQGGGGCSGFGCTGGVCGNKPVAGHGARVRFGADREVKVFQSNLFLRWSEPYRNVSGILVWWG